GLGQEALDTVPPFGGNRPGRQEPAGGALQRQPVVGGPPDQDRQRLVGVCRRLLHGVTPGTSVAPPLTRRILPAIVAGRKGARPSMRALTSTGVPAGVWRRALATRLPMAWRR